MGEMVEADLPIECYNFTDIARALETRDIGDYVSGEIPHLFSRNPICKYTKKPLIYQGFM